MGNRLGLQAGENLLQVRAVAGLDGAEHADREHVAAREGAFVDDLLDARAGVGDAAWSAPPGRRDGR